MSKSEELKGLCRGRVEDVNKWTQTKGFSPFLTGIAVILIGSSCYGFTIGLWRSPLQGIYAAIKFPLLILLTTLGNALINGMLAQILGLRISFRQSTLAVLASFVLASLLLGALAPVSLFITFNTPPLTSEFNVAAHSFTKLMHVLLIALAGTVACLRLFRLLIHLAQGRIIARRVLIAWLIGAFVLGSQLAWIMRPFIGAPHLPVEFLRKEAFQGNFYECVYESATQLWRLSENHNHQENLNHERRN